MPKAGEPSSAVGLFLKGDEHCRSVSAQPLMLQTHPVRGVVASAERESGRPSGRALLEVGLHQPTLLNTDLLPGFTGTQEETVLGLISHLVHFYSQVDLKMPLFNHTEDKNNQRL